MAEVGSPKASSITVIRPRRGLSSIGLGELWTYRELLYFFIWRDVKLRYKQTYFGAAWALIQPLLLMAVFTLFVGQLNGVAPSGIPYPLFAFAGLVPWTLFAQSLIGSSNSLVGASNLLQKVYFPRLLLPLAATGSYLLDYAIGLGALALLMFIYGYMPTPTALWLIPVTGLAVMTALAVGVWLAAVNVRYRDVRYAVPFLVQIWLFASPVAYATSIVPAGWQWLFRLNPMTGVLEGFRWAVLGGATPPIEATLISTLVAAVVLISGVAYFQRVERTFADVI